jgi:hypothetical protein
MPRVIKGMSPGMLGHGCSPAAIAAAAALEPDYIAVDAGTTDVGAYYMGAGVPFYHPLSVGTDLLHLVGTARRLKVPLIIGNAITAGTDALVEKAMTILRLIATELGLELTVGIVTSQLPKSFVLQRLQQGRIVALGAPRTLSEQDVEDAVVIVAQMGVEPIIRALETHPDIIVAGRACDDALFAALPVKEGMDRGLALHMGKIIECGTMACIPGDLHGTLIGEIYDDHFILVPPEQHRSCSTQSVASHTLYERSNPYLQAGPGGLNDLHEAEFIQLDDRRVAVRGSRWVADAKYRVKIEGVRPGGFRTICMGGIRDPFLIGCLNEVLDAALKDTALRFSDRGGNRYEIVFRTYGRDAVMGNLEPEGRAGHEAGLLIEVLGETQELADAVCMYVRGTIQHAYYPGIVATAGNLAYPFSPFTVPCGPTYRFHIDHLLELDRPDECFNFHSEVVGRRSVATVGRVV